MMNNKENNLMTQNEEAEILSVVDAHAKRGSLASKVESSEYDEVFALLSRSRDSFKPDAALLKKTLKALPKAAVATLPAGEVVGTPSPYTLLISQFFGRQSSWKFATSALVLFLAVATVIGTTPKKTIPPSVAIMSDEATPATDMMTTESAPTAFSMAKGAAPVPMMMKMSQTTLPSTTPQNVGELIALLSNEADEDIDLGLSDASDPLYSADADAVNAFTQSYDTQTI